MDILVDCAERVMTITLNRIPKKNAITSAMYQSMVDALDQAAEDTHVRAILIRGGEGIFSAGNDLEDFMKAPPMGESAPVIQFLHRISGIKKPLVASVAGVAIGIGVTLLMHCDLVYAAETATFSLPFAQLGLCPEAASSLLLPRIAGYQCAAEKLLLGETFNVQEAYRMGFVNRILPAHEVDAFALKQAAKLAALPASSLRITKLLMKCETQQAVSERINSEAVYFGQMLAAPEAREAMMAFFQKRQPDFSQFD